MKKLSFDKIENYRDAFLKESKNIVRMNAGAYNNIGKIVTSPDKIYSNPFNFNIDIKQGEPTMQKQSGRCWMFASLNVIRNVVMKKYNLEEFEFSQSYPLFFDKLERANLFFEAIMETSDEDITSRVVQYLNDTVLGDGGQWDMFVNLVLKYGLVPKYAYPETFTSSNTRELNKYLTKLVRIKGLRLREAVLAELPKSEILKIKEEALNDVYNVLRISLGTPPEKFDFNVKDKEGKVIEIKDLTPLKFFKEVVDFDIENYVSLINAPTADKPFNNTYTIQYLGNVVEGREVKHLNLTSEELQEVAIKQLKDGIPVWFGCDVGKEFYKGDKKAILDVGVKDFEKLFGINLEMSKEDSLDYLYSCMTHAMTFTGVELNQESPIRWKVENSWGKDFGYEGYLVMSNEWFNKYVYQVVVNKKYLSKAQLDNYDKKPIMLKPWDPMGSLA